MLYKSELKREIKFKHHYFL